MLVESRPTPRGRYRIAVRMNIKGMNMPARMATTRPNRHRIRRTATSRGILYLWPRKSRAWSGIIL